MHRSTKQTIDYIVKKEMKETQGTIVLHKINGVLLIHCFNLCSDLGVNFGNVRH